jgi:hypothetical protein
MKQKKREVSYENIRPQVQKVEFNLLNLWSYFDETKKREVSYENIRISTDAP